jgi:hypothetical protein
MNATRDHSFEIVGAETLECELNQVRAAAAGSLAGIFGPRSMTWRVDREAAIFLGAGRALLLQLAHPWIAAAIGQHSDTFADPISRFHRTFSVVFTMVFGRLEQSLTRRSPPASSSLRHQRHDAVGCGTARIVCPRCAGCTLPSRRQLLWRTRLCCRR